MTKPRTLPAEAAMREAVLLRALETSEVGTVIFTSARAAGDIRKARTASTTTSRAALDFGVDSEVNRSERARFTHSAPTFTLCCAPVFTSARNGIQIEDRWFEDGC